MALGTLGIELYASSSRLEGDMGRAAQIVESRARAMDAAAAKAARSIESVGTAAASIGRVGGIREAANDMQGLEHATVGARREMLVIAHELFTGNFKKAAGSVMVLGERMDWMHAIMSRTGAMIGLTAGAVLLFATACIKGAEESAKFATAIQLTGNYAGLTEGQFNDMAKSVAASANVTIGEARELTQAFVSTGRFSGVALESVSIAAATLASMTGQKTEEIIKDFTKMTDGVLKWALEANKQYHFVDVALYEHVKALEEQGRKEEAEALVLDALNKHLGVTTQNLGWLEKAWDGVKGAASGAWDAMKGIGRDTTIDDRIKQIKDQLEAIPKTGIMGGVRQPGVDPRAALEGALRSAVKEKMRQDDNALLEQQKSAGRDRDVANREFYDKLIKDTRTREQERADAIQDINRRADQSQWSPEMRAKAIAAAEEKYKDKKTGGGTAHADLSAALQPLQAQMTEENKLLTQREQALQRYYKDDQISIQGYYTTQETIIGAHMKRVSDLYDQEIAIQRRYAVNAKDAGARTEALTKASELAAKKEEGLSADREKLAVNTEAMRRDTQGYTDEVEKLTAALNKLQGQPGVSAGAEWDRTHKKLVDQAKAAGDVGTQGTLAQDREAFIAQQTMNDLKVRAQQIEENLAITEKTISLQTQTGQETELQGMTDIGTARQKTIDQLNVINAQMQQIAANSGLPALITEADQFKLKVDELAASSNVLGKTFNDIFQNSFAKFIDNAITGTKSFKQNFLDMANSIEQAIARIVAQDLAAKLFGVGNSAGGSGGGGLIGQLLGLFGSSGAAGANAAAGAGVEVGGAIDTAMPMVVAALASGGPAYGGGMYQVNENGPELLTVANKTYLMMGDQGGKVTPMGDSAAGGPRNTFNMNIAVPPGTTRATAQQQASEIMRHAQISMARNG
ncbi:phage tail tape measure protein [Paraburkholderia panacisoli]|uniref:Phage tail tape measure protein n=1 Tax=Paraburkholderia panacisoli TaxID=2603818 RepID=A0A5B0HL17_9BURK|nr:phage tail length tape measure family protein [Paraburkholderia panacisoli]KAA1015976.1 phage tail tape measure protein [Paraburkholderia panacisoli]